MITVEQDKRRFRYEMRAYLLFHIFFFGFMMAFDYRQMEPQGPHDYYVVPVKYPTTLLNRHDVCEMRMSQRMIQYRMRDVNWGHEWAWTDFVHAECPNAKPVMCLQGNKGIMVVVKYNDSSFVGIESDHDGPKHYHFSNKTQSIAYDSLMDTIWVAQEDYMIGAKFDVFFDILRNVTTNESFTIARVDKEPINEMVVSNNRVFYVKNDTIVLWKPFDDTRMSLWKAKRGKIDFIIAPLRDDYLLRNENLKPCFDGTQERVQINRVNTVILMIALTVYFFMLLSFLVYLLCRNRYYG